MSQDLGDDSCKGEMIRRENDGVAFCLVSLFSVFITAKSQGEQPYGN